MKSILTLSIIIISFLSNSFALAQTKEMQGAFAESYNYEAIAKYEAAINAIKLVFSDKSYECNLRLGWLYYLQGNFKESVAHYKKSSELMPAATEPKWAILLPLEKQENYAEIEKVYIAILKLDAKNTDANYNLALIYYYRKDYFTAKKYFDVVLNLKPFNYNYMLYSAWNQYFLGNKMEAKTLFNKVLMYSPNDASALEGLSLIK